MAHEVVKTVKGHQYRYRVERVRDETTGKMRAQWIYLGPVGATGPRQPRAQRESSRDAILAAFTRLLDRRKGESLPGVDAITKEAGLAHGTFYRYFSNKDMAIDALIQQIRSEVDDVRPDGTVPPASRDQARQELSTWVKNVCRTPFQQQGIIFVWMRRLMSDPKLQADYTERRAKVITDLVAFFSSIHELGFAQIPHPLPLANAILVLLEGAFRAPIFANTTDEETAQNIADFIDRTIFGNVS